MKEYRKPKAHFGPTRATVALPPGEPTIVHCDDECGAKLSCFIKLLRDTLLIKNNSANEIEITEDGMVVEVINNPSNPELGPEELHTLHRHLVKVTEGRDTLPQLSVAAIVGRPEEDLDKVNEQIRYYFNCGAFIKPRWMTFMVPPPLANIPLTADDLKKEVLDTKNNTVVIYYRALERAPGGNTDTFVTKFIVEGGKSVRVASYRNWDGSAQRSPVQPLGNEQAEGHILGGVQNGIAPTLIKLIESGKNIQDGNIRYIEGTIDEEAHTNEEYSTQWSSIEILLFKGSVPEGAVPEQACPLLLRVHQRSVLVNWRQGWTAPKLVEPRDPASDELLAVIDATGNTVLMGTTEEFSEGQSPSGSLFGSLKKENVEGMSSDAMPIYIMN